MPFVRAVPKRDTTINTDRMTQEDLDLIKYYQAWRRDESDHPLTRLAMPNPTEVGKALDRMIAYCELCMKLNENN